MLMMWCEQRPAALNARLRSLRLRRRLLVEPQLIGLSCILRTPLLLDTAPYAAPCASAWPEQRRKRPVQTDRSVLQPPTAQATMHHLTGALLSSRRD